MGLKMDLYWEREKDRKWIYLLLWTSPVMWGFIIALIIKRLYYGSDLEVDNFEKD